MRGRSRFGGGFASKLTVAAPGTDAHCIRDDAKHVRWYEAVFGCLYTDNADDGAVDAR